MGFAILDDRQQSPQLVAENPTDEHSATGSSQNFANALSR